MTLQTHIFLAEADKTLELVLIFGGVEVCRCAPMVPTTPILHNSNHSVGKERAREVDLYLVLRLSIQEA